MNLTLCLALMLLVVPAALLAAPPEICRVQGGNTKLVYGVGFDASVEVWGWSPTGTPEEAVAALAAGKAGVGELPAQPPEKAKRLRVLDRDATGLVMAVDFSNNWNGSGFFDGGFGDGVCWVKNAEGWSRPWLVHAAQAWWAYPEEARAGERVRVFGRNLSTPTVRLRAANGKLLEAALTGSGRNALYEAWLDLPEDLGPGEYAVLIHNGTGGPGAWSAPVKVRVVKPETKAGATVKALEAGAKGDGSTDDTAALQRALEQVKRKGGGRVLLGAGRYAISGCLTVPEGVSLEGSGVGCSTLEVRAERAMQGDFPAAAELEGYPRDWLPHMKGHGYVPMVWLRSESRLSNLTLRGGPGVGMGVLIARCPGVARQVTIEDCQFFVDNAVKWWVNTVPIRLAGNSYGLVIRRCELVGQGGVEVISTDNRQAYVGYNNVRCVPQGHSNNLFLRGFKDSVVENNMARDGDRNFACQLGGKLGRHELVEGKPYPGGSMYHVAIMGNSFFNSIPRRHNEGETMFEAGGALWHGHPVKVTADTVQAAGDPFWTDLSEQYVMVLDGRGLGQYRKVASNTQDTLKLAESWAVVPDASSYVMVSGFFAETLWLDNTEEHTANWTGWWGNNVGNVMDGHILRDGSGVYLWGWSRDIPSPVAFNELIGCYLSPRANIEFIGQLVFGNTVRFCEIVDFRYRPSYHGSMPWMGGDPAKRYGIDLTEPSALSFSQEGGEAIVGLPASAPVKAWTVLEGNHLYNGPAGIRVGKGNQHVILRQNVVTVEGEALSDETGAAGQF